MDKVERYLTGFRYNKILVALIVIGLLSAMTIVWQRHQVEQANRQVELVLDYEDVLELAQLDGVPLSVLMQQIKAAGVTSLSVYDTTLEKLNKSGKVTGVAGSDVMHAYRTGTLAEPWWRQLVEAGKISADEVYIVGYDPAVFAEVRADVIRRTGAGRVVDLPGGRFPVIAVKANYEKFVKWNLGLSSDEMKAVAQAGFYVVPRPTNYTKVRAEDVHAVFDRIQAIPQVSTIMFVGEETLGYPDQLAATTERMKAQKLTLGMIEHPLQLQFLKQEGLTALATALQYQAARVYVIPKEEQPKLKPAEAVQRWAVTDQERNIRIDLLRKYDKPLTGKTVVETNLEYFSAVRDGLVAKGFTVGRASYFTPYFPEKWLLSLLILGATAAGVLYLSLVRPFSTKGQLLLLLCLAGLLLVPIWKGSGTLVRQAAATASAVLFPVLSMTWLLDRWRQEAPQAGAGWLRILLAAGGSLCLVSAFSLAGGLYVAALLGDVRFFLEMEIFRGVKLTFVAPLLLAAVAYMVRFDLFEREQSRTVGSIWQQLLEMLKLNVTVQSLLIFAVLAIGAWVFVGRSGHTAGVPVPEIEIKLRQFLEQAMYARPREKEFMIGHPAFFLAVWAWYHKWPRLLHFALFVVAVIAQGSMVETFAHLRTPVFMSFIRGVDGIAVGLFFGLVAVAGVQALRYLSFLLGRRPSVHE